MYVFMMQYLASPPQIVPRGRPLTHQGINYSESPVENCLSPLTKLERATNRKMLTIIFTETHDQCAEFTNQYLTIRWPCLWGDLRELEYVFPSDCNILEVSYSKIIRVENGFHTVQTESCENTLHRKWFQHLIMPECVCVRVQYARSSNVDGCSNKHTGPVWKGVIWCGQGSGLLPFSSADKARINTAHVPQSSQSLPLTKVFLLNFCWGLRGHLLKNAFSVLLFMQICSFFEKVFRQWQPLGQIRVTTHLNTMQDVQLHWYHCNWWSLK